MRQKEKMTETVIRNEVRVQRDILYKYELVLTESDRFSSYGIPLYSINVELTHADGNITYAKSDKLFADLGAATDFFEKLVRNLATPIDLRYVIEDEFYKHR